MRSPAAQTKYSSGKKTTDLTRQILHTSRAHERDHDTGLAFIPSERALAEQLGVKRYAIRKALDLLTRSGQVRRLGKRGMVVVDHVEGPRQVHGVPLSSITFVLGSALKPADMQWLVQSYLVGYTEALEPYAIRTRFIVWDDQQQDYENLLWSQTPWKEQACLLVNTRQPELLHWLSEKRIPYVVQNHAAYADEGLPPHHSVYVNKAGGIFEATRYLLEQGHRRIGFVGPISDRHGVCFEYDGYVAAMHSAGLAPYPSDLLNFITQVPELAVEPLTRYLDCPDRPTAVVTSSGALALGMLESAKTVRVRVPEDLSIVGLSSHQTLDYADLSTVDVPRHELARTALSLLIDSVRKPVPTPLRKILNCRLQVRRSMGPAPTDREIASPIAEVSNQALPPTQSSTEELTR